MHGRKLDNLIEEARTIGNHKTPKAAVTVALTEYIGRRKRQESAKRRKQLRILEMVGEVEYFDDYNYKALRRKEAVEHSN